MNKEALPFVAAILVPVVFVTLILLYINGYLDKIVSFLKGIDLIYYIIIFPIVLGFILALLKLRKMD